MTKPEFRWVHVHNKDELEAFYRGVIPNIIQEAKYHGYAIGVHGSLRRDLDLIAAPWRDNPAAKDDLARAIQEAACGMPEESYTWEQKPCGRVAVSFPVCWTERSEEFPNETNLGHIDLSVMAVTARPEEQTQEPAAWLEITDDGDIIGASLFRDKEELPKGWRWEPVYRRPPMNSGSKS